MRVGKYGSFIQERRINAIIGDTQGIDLNQGNDSIFADIFESLLKKQDKAIIEEISGYLYGSRLLNESFFDKLKSRFPKATTVSNILSDKSEQALGAILQKAKDAVSFITDFSARIKKFFTDSIVDLKVKMEELIKTGDLVQKIKALNDKDKEGLKKDLITTKDIVKWYRTEFLPKFIESIKKNSSEFFGKEHDAVSESMINEGGNVIATLVHKLEEYPPFSWLSKVQQAGEAGSNKLIEVLSTVTSKMGGPSFELPIIAVLLGVVLEQIVKNFAGHGLIDLVGATTPLGIAVKGVKMVALFIAFIVSLDAIVGQSILGKGHGDHADHEHHEEKVEIVAKNADGSEKEEDMPE